MSSSMGAEIEAEPDGFRRECSMCGDVGFSSELFQCKKCDYRWQHTYCSRLYPKIGFGSGNWVCDWCFAAVNASSASEHKGDEQSPTSPSTKAKRKASSKLSPSSQMQQQWDAFEYLLEVAQTASFNDGEISSCVPVVERQACSSKRTCARKIKLSSSSSSSNNNNNNSFRFKFNPRQQQQHEIHQASARTDLSKTSSTKNFLVQAKTRYKLLSDM